MEIIQKHWKTSWLQNLLAWSIWAKIADEIVVSYSVDPNYFLAKLLTGFYSINISVDSFRILEVPQK